MKTTKSKKNEIIILFMLLLMSLTMLLINEYFNKDVNSFKAPNDFAKISLTIIEDVNCEYCQNLTRVIDKLKQDNNITNITYLTKHEATYLINFYDINKFPTIVIKGQLFKLNEEGFKRIKDALIYTDTTIYSDKIGLVFGTHTLIKILPEDCYVCEEKNIDHFYKNYVITSERNINSLTNEAKQLIELLNITRLPASIVFKDLKVQEILEKQTPFYLDLKTNQIRGFVNITYILAEDCGSCYDVYSHKTILESKGLYIQNEQSLNQSFATELIDKYNISKLPTILLSEDASLYFDFLTSWKQVGTIEVDGVLVFREPGVIGTYVSLN